MTRQIVKEPSVYSVRTRAYLTPYTVDTARFFVDGYTAVEVAHLMGSTIDGVKDAIKRVRVVLSARGYAVGNTIMLRKAMRAEGLIDDLEMI